MKRPPTDFEILRAIRERHHQDFADRTSAEVAAALMVPIDIPELARDLRTDSHSLHGRLYHHLEKVYGERAEAGKPRKAFFLLRAGEEVHCVNFPMLEAVLAGLWVERRRDQTALWTALLSLLISSAALVVSLLAA